MTSDAKIGLLLGLVFIFVIAFIINGLPSLHDYKNDNELTANMVNSQNNQLGLSTNERKVYREVIINQPVPVKQQSTQVQIQHSDNQDIRFTIPLSNNPLPLEEALKSIANKSIEPTSPKIYSVCDGDNLVAIAKKIYGSEEGKKQINITKIFQANTDTLKSPDEIHVGQKLIIPPLSNLPSDKSQIVQSAGNAEPAQEKSQIPPLSNLPSDKSQTVQSAGNSEPTQEKYTNEHVVQEGESLWQIAAEKLGNGKRYTEITKLNTDVLNDGNNLTIGMRLKLPAR